MTRSAFQRISAGLYEALDFVEGRPTKVRVRMVAVSKHDLKRVRKGMKLTQEQFAPLLGVSVSGLRKIEQGQRPVAGALATLVTVMEREPDAVLRAVRSSQVSTARTRVLASR